MLSLEEKIAILLKNYHNVILTTDNRNRVVKEIMAEIYSSGFKQVIFPLEQTCGEALEKVTGILYDQGIEMPIILGEDIGDIVHSPEGDHYSNLEGGRFKK